MVLLVHMTNKNHYISSTTVPLTTKLGRMMTCLDGFLPKRSYEPLIGRNPSRQVIWLDSEIYCEAPNHKVVQRFDHVSMQSHKTNKNHYISTTCNHFHNILRPLDVLSNFPLTTSETMRDYYL